MRLRLGTLALAAAASVSHLADARGLTLYLLLAAVLAASAAGLEAVGEVVEGRRARSHAVLGGLTLLLMLVAATAHAPELALGCLATYALQELNGLLSRRPLPEI